MWHLSLEWIMIEDEIGNISHEKVVFTGIEQEVGLAMLSLAILRIPNDYVKFLQLMTEKVNIEWFNESSAIWTTARHLFILDLFFIFLMKVQYSYFLPNHSLFPYLFLP